MDRKRRIRSYYNSLASSYGRLHNYDYAGGDYFVSKSYSILKSHIDPDAKLILELGCGDGRFVEQMGQNTVGIDFSKNMVLQAKERCPANQFIVADIQTLPLRDGSFPCIYSVNVLYHFQNYQSVLSEAHRVLAKNGEYVLIDYNPLCPWWYVQSIIDRKVYLQRTLINLISLSGERFHFTPLRLVNKNVVRFFRRIEGVLEKTPLKSFGGFLLVVEKKNAKNEV